MSIGTSRTRSRPCDRARALANHAWVGLMAVEVGVSPPFDPEGLAERALIFLNSCAEKFRIPNVLAMLALSRIHDGDASTALQHVAAARAYAPSIPADVQWWLAEAEARAAGLEHRYADARRAYGQLAAVAKQRGFASARWRAHIGVAAIEQGAGPTPIRRPSVRGRRASTRRAGTARAVSVAPVGAHPPTADGRASPRQRAD